jgi:hypothetical protein
MSDRMGRWVHQNRRDISTGTSITGLAILLAGLGLFAAVKTWLSWNHEVHAHGQVFVQSVDDHPSTLLAGLFPLLGGVAGIAGIGAGVVQRDGYDFLSKGERAYAVTAFCLMSLAIVYGACVMGLEAATHSTDWYGTKHLHLTDGVWPQLEATSIAVMSVGGVVLGVGRFLSRKQKKSQGE